MFVALGMQHATRCALLSSVACPHLHFFFTLSHKRQDFRGGGVIIHKICELSLQLLSEIFCILRRTKRDMIINVKCPLLSDFDNT